MGQSAEILISNVDVFLERRLSLIISVAGEGISAPALPRDEAFRYLCQHSSDAWQHFPGRRVQTLVRPDHGYRGSHQLICDCFRQ